MLFNWQITVLSLQWVLECEDEATVEILLTALTHENFTDVKIKVEDLINID